MNELTWLLIGVGIGIVIGITWAIMLAYMKGDALIHRIRYKEWVLPCPACRDENDKPTGVITPSNPLLQQELGEQTFDCSTCDGTKKIVYEFPRLEPPEIDSRQMLTSPAPDGAQPRPKRGLFR